jgi:hypothetical protein
MLKLHDIGPCFLELLPAFRVTEELSEKGQSLWSISRPQDGQIGKNALRLKMEQR